MVYKRQLQFKINGEYINPPSDYEVRRRKLKHLRKYQKKIQNSAINDLPELMKQFYSYILKKSLLRDSEYIKQELIRQVDILLTSYQYNLPPEIISKDQPDNEQPSYFLSSNTIDRYLIDLCLQKVKNKDYKTQYQTYRTLMKLQRLVA